MTHPLVPIATRHITENCRLEHVVRDDVRVLAPARVEVIGVVDGDLIIDHGAAAIVAARGRVTGTIVNRGGELRVAGCARAVVNEGDATSVVDRHALLEFGMFSVQPGAGAPPSDRELIGRPAAPPR